MTTPMSPQMMPMTPAFGPMRGSAMPYAPAPSQPAPSDNKAATNFEGSQPQPYYNAAAPVQTMSNSISMPMPNSFPAYPQSYNPTPQYGGMSVFPSLPTTVYRSANPGQAQPTFISSVARPKPISAPYSSVMDQNIQYVSPEEFAHLFEGPKEMPVTRIAHTQTRPLPPAFDTNNFTPVAVAPKYSTQMSARVKYQGPAFKGNLIPQPVSAAGQQSIMVSVQPMPKPNQLPVAAHSYAVVTSTTPKAEFAAGSKILAEFYLDRKWYPGIVRFFDAAKGQYLIDWADKDEHDRWKLPEQIMKRDEICTIS